MGCCCAKAASSDFDRHGEESVDRPLVLLCSLWSCHCLARDLSPLVKLLENPLLIAVVLTAGGRALHVVELPLFGERPPLMAVVLVAGGRALLVEETPMLWKKPPLMAVVPAANCKALHLVELPLFGKKPPLMAVVLAAGGIAMCLSLVFEMLYIKKFKPNLNMQMDSIRAKLFEINVTNFTYLSDNINATLSF